jgi:hypothetical protein
VDVLSAAQPAHADNIGYLVDFNAKVTPGYR